MRYKVVRIRIAAASDYLRRDADQLETIINRLKAAVAHVAAINQADEITEFKSIYDGSADKALMNLVQELDNWSIRLSAIYSEYYQAQCDSCTEALQALNKL